MKMGTISCRFVKKKIKPKKRKLSRILFTAERSKAQPEEIKAQQADKLA